MAKRSTNRESHSKREKITAAEFIEIWQCKNIDNPLWAAYYHQQEAAYGTTRRMVILNNVDIEGTVELKDENDQLTDLQLINSSLNALNIYNCKLGHLVIKGQSKINNIDFGKKSSAEYLIVSNATLGNLTVWGEATCDFITFDTQARVSSLSIDGENTKGGYLHISDAKIGLIEVVKKASVTDIDIIRSGINHLYLHDHAVADNVKIGRDAICLDLEINSVDIRERLVIDQAKINDFSFQVKTLLEASITDSFVQKLEYKSLTSSTFNLIGCTVLRFAMERIRTGKDSLIQLINCRVNDLCFDTVLNLASFNIKSLKPITNGERFKYFKGGIELIPGTGQNLYEMEPFQSISKISIISSDLGKTMFSSDLSTFDKFYFANSKIIEAFIAGPKLPIISTIEGENLDEQKRIAFNQIKKIYENRGDQITAMKYQRLEMEIYREQVRNKAEDKIPGEQFQLSFNQFTNRHGTEWRFPLFLALSSGIILYVIYCFCLYPFNRYGRFQWGLIPYFFEFLNPTHKVDFLKTFKLNLNTGLDNIALIVDAVSRILIPLILYQMFQAFRKYGKK